MAKDVVHSIITIFFKGSRGSSVSIVATLRNWQPRNCGSIPGKER